MSMSMAMSISACSRERKHCGIYCSGVVARTDEIKRKDPDCNLGVLGLHVRNACLGYLFLVDSFDSLPCYQVPSQGTKEFALQFMAYKEGTTAAKVTFTNDDKGEYLFHELKMTTTAPDIQVNSFPW